MVNLLSLLIPTLVSVHLTLLSSEGSQMSIIESQVDLSRELKAIGSILHSYTDADCQIIRWKGRVATGFSTYTVYCIKDDVDVRSFHLQHDDNVVIGENLELLHEKLSAESGSDTVNFEMIVSRAGHIDLELDYAGSEHNLDEQ